MSSSTTNNTS